VVLAVLEVPLEGQLALEDLDTSMELLLSEDRLALEYQAVPADLAALVLEDPDMLTELLLLEDQPVLVYLEALVAPLALVVPPVSEALAVLKALGAPPVLPALAVLLVSGDPLVSAALAMSMELLVRECLVLLEDLAMLVVPPVLVSLEALQVPVMWKALPVLEDRVVLLALVTSEDQEVLAHLVASKDPAALQDQVILRAPLVLVYLAVLGLLVALRDLEAPLAPATLEAQLAPESLEAAPPRVTLRAPLAQLAVQEVPVKSRALPVLARRPPLADAPARKLELPTTTISTSMTCMTSLDRPLLPLHTPRSRPAGAGLRSGAVALPDALLRRASFSLRPRLRGAYAP
jgi:hypothetical protein